MKSIISGKLRFLNGVITDLVKCQTRDEAIKKALAKIREHLKVQVASVFLLTKEGVIQRKGIDGIDIQNNPIGDDWLPDEHYQRGESFSGFSIPFPSEDDKSDYGEPNYVNNIQEKYPDMKYGKEYLEKLGKLQCGISVPLNNSSGTFGILEVLNKKKECQFTSDDLYFLMLVGSNLAEVISSFYTEEYNKIFKSLIANLVELQPNRKDFNLNNFYKEITEKIISDFTPYKVCIIRIPDENESLSIQTQVCNTDISLEGRKDSSLSRENSQIVGKVFETKEPLFIDNVESRLDQFHNKDWVKEQKLKSIACLPLLHKEACIGTISIYTKYRMKFSNIEKNVLNFLAFLIATITQRVHDLDELQRVTKELNEAKEQFFNISMLIGYETKLQDFVHKYKDELVEIRSSFKKLLGNEKSQEEEKNIINERLKWLKKRMTELTGLILEDKAIPVNINDLVKQVIKNLSMDNSIEFKEKYGEIPIIYVNEHKIKTVIHNLISNAIIAIDKAKNEQGQISIITKVSEKKDIPLIELLVEDNGIGIPNENHDKIFNQGFTTRRGEGGTGLGLHISKLIVNQYGGRIYFESEINQGTKFFVQIPIKRYQNKEN